MTKTTTIALTIAGSDSGGGAGVQADIKAISANGAYAASVITAITAQNTLAVTDVHEVPAGIVGAQIDAVLSDLDVDVIKLGMLFSQPIIKAVAQRLAGFDGPVVVDPVMIAKSGDALLQDAAVAAMVTHILPHATLLTPNLPEAARLLNTTEANTPEEMAAQGQRLIAMGPKAVLMKGGHAIGGTCTDVLVDAQGVVTTCTAARIETGNTHGTGCTYSAAIAAQLAQAVGLKEAVKAAHSYLQAAIKAADSLTIGQGHGPVHHFYGQWK
ncbi:bifunctional hydroxymethylpyrimidine kinase/phosphomethylpyrimidine kinase [Sulfitobacter sp. M57]|uniref:bifunctional hydroxymethylpyrimidine kinase/phosphomethylpyrimidine kinase n=1 Tax=unclassified Sulfitobacter TaxID=196795 RepID=UPI0023E33572|nr:MULTISPECIES: bifunctional hydroxymethylpyrimidine kinase/phosphomethylpyrimidine kinase [unclassified Sulfitobacter]MDF3414775.1 bifunctional hydroxymethylpyrimidine kinase/phosphomethylpyrimidine kinase [Sulfitobacter sp. KE5]MDF3422256.1 bifunctional hydroxymethylpyrimidine kinase/phosphomethylpyrimidine kinase [Sulfitobacter sp. KE43]MDF3433321.1 bifunctional hydroxymethylpyrimidine kinase/phosphomethylpyrimidine kinase [Sulfitobacter sp. KE42]MDF3458961.1 bifunctional hydroxymethylpyrim